MARVSTKAAAALVALAGLASSGAPARKPAAPGVVVNDVLGGFFVAYAIHKASLDVVAALSGAPSRGRGAAS